MENYAEYWQRAVAFIIDVVIVGIANWVIMFIIWLPAMFDPTGVMTLIGWIASFIVPVVIVILYFGLMEASDWQGTVGKKIMSIQVTTVEGSPLSKGQAFGRNGVRALLLAIPVLNILGALGDYLTPLFNENKQTLHDMALKTIVVKA